MFGDWRDNIVQDAAVPSIPAYQYTTLNPYTGQADPELVRLKQEWENYQTMLLDIKAHFGASRGGANYQAALDLDGNGEIDIFDVNEIAKKLSTVDLMITNRVRTLPKPDPIDQGANPIVIVMPDPDPGPVMDPIPPVNNLPVPLPMPSPAPDVGTILNPDPPPIADSLIKPSVDKEVESLVPTMFKSVTINVAQPETLSKASTPAAAAPITITTSSPAPQVAGSNEPNYVKMGAVAAAVLLVVTLWNR